MSEILSPELLEASSGGASHPPGHPSPVAPDTFSETIEDHARRVLRIAAESPENLKVEQYTEIAVLADAIALRARAWKRIAQRPRDNAEWMVQQAERVQQLAEKLNAVVARLENCEGIR